MRIVFMGTPDFAVPSLRALIEDGDGLGRMHDVVAVYTQPPRPAGRGKKERKSPVHLFAEARGIPVHCPKTLRDLAVQAELAAYKPDIIVTAAYGLILPRAVLDIGGWAPVNVHASLLPKWRGAAPIQRAILAGDHVTGVTIMWMEEGLDTGPMILSAKTPIEDKTAGELTEELAELGAGLLIEALTRIDLNDEVEQDDREATHAPKIDKSEARLHWDKTAERLEREVRAFSPFPGSWFEFDGERIKVLRARMIGVNGAPGTVLDEELTIACGNAALRPTQIQRAGKPAMATADFLRGRPVPVGTVLR